MAGMDVVISIQEILKSDLYAKCSNIESRWHVRKDGHNVSWQMEILQKNKKMLKIKKHCNRVENNIDGIIRLNKAAKESPSLRLYQ